MTSPPRRAWVCLSGAIALWIIGSVLWFVFVLPLNPLPFPSVADWAWLGSYPLLFAAAVLLIHGQLERLRLTVVLDALVCVLGTVMLASAFLLRPVVDSLGGSTARVIVNLAYPVLDVLLLGLVVAGRALIGWRGGRALALLFAGLVVLTVADIGYLVDVARNPYAQGGPLDGGWPVAFLLIALAVGRLPAKTVGRAAAPADLLTGMPVLFMGGAGLILAVGGTVHRMPIAVSAMAAFTLLIGLVRVGVAYREAGHLVLARAEARTDELTGLLNRRGVYAEAADLLASGSATSVAILDLDRFKEVNDREGHDVGDRLLIEVARRLRQLMGEGVLLGRFEGDEFAVVLAGRDPAAAEAVLQQVIAALADPLVLEGLRVQVGASAGLAHASRGGEIDELLRHADSALRRAKRVRGKALSYVPELDGNGRLELAHALVAGIRRGELRLLYQPQVELMSGRVNGVEALERWEHPLRGLLTPDAFLPAAEATNAILELDDWVLRQACVDLARWERDGCDLSVAVNVSAERLGARGFASEVAEALARSGAPASRLEIEVTETAAVADGEAAIRALEDLRALGVTAAIDDFGMGYSALSRLQRLPFARLKIDRSFIASLTPEAAQSGSLVAAMVQMAGALDMSVVAEGVETVEHLAALRSLGCQTGQGYLFSRPVPADQIPALAAKRLASVVALAPRPAEEPTVRALLAELSRVTGLESTYLSEIDQEDDRQRILSARNSGELDMSEGIVVRWSDTLCRRALERRIGHTADVPGCFPDSSAAAQLGIQSYAMVPLYDPEGKLTGSLCGASRRRVALNDSTRKVMESFADLLSLVRSTSRGEEREAA